MKWKAQKTKEKRVRVEDFWRNRVGMIKGVTKEEYMRGIYGEIIAKWDQNKYRNKWILLYQISRWITKEEKTRNIQCYRVKNFTLDDRNIDVTIKFGERIITKHIYFQPDDDITAQRIRDKFEDQAEKFQESGKIAVENYIMQQRVPAQIVNNKEQI